MKTFDPDQASAPEEGVKIPLKGEMKKKIRIKSKSPNSLAY